MHIWREKVFYKGEGEASREYSIKTCRYDIYRFIYSQHMNLSYNISES